MDTSFSSHDTPAGKIFICESAGKIIHIGFERTMMDETSTPLIEETKKQLDEYINGKRRTFNFPFAVLGSELQNDVCNALMRIPYGETRTYKEIATDVGRPTAVRAVASAIGRNPIAIVIPCHRVIGSDGRMRGFAGGIPFKEYLLGVEGWSPPGK